jgi:RimJ/RimL family protein N-acetyltransferase
VKTVCLHLKSEIESFLRKNTFLHIYSIGDLDDFFWNYTTWYALKKEEEIKEIILLYTGMDLPTLLVFTEGNLDLMNELLESIIHLLPKRFYTHLTPGLSKILKRGYKLESSQSHGLYYKMALKNKSLLDNIDTSGVVSFSTKNVDELLEFYKESYPDNWFDPRTLETNQYYGIRNKKGLISVAGIHLYSTEYKVAALGNITTHPDFRGKGLAKIVTAHLCKSLLQSIDHIGLNVNTENKTAISCYEKIGFEVISSYEEYMADLKIQG